MFHPNLFTNQLKELLFSCQKHLQLKIMKPLHFFGPSSPGRFKLNTAGTPMSFVGFGCERHCTVKPNSSKTGFTLITPIITKLHPSVSTLSLVPSVSLAVPFPGADGSLPRLRGRACLCSGCPGPAVGMAGCLRWGLFLPAQQEKSPHPQHALTSQSPNVQCMCNTPLCCR